MSSNRNRPIQGKKVFILLSDLWFIQYEYIEHDGLFKYGLRLRYKNTGTDFKYIYPNTESYSSELEMKKAIKSEVAKWMIEKKDKYKIDMIPIDKVQEIVHKQLTLWN